MSLLGTKLETPPCSSCSENWDPTTELWEFGQRLFRVHPKFTKIVAVYIRALNNHKEETLYAQVRRFFKNVESNRRRKIGKEMTRR